MKVLIVGKDVKIIKGGLFNIIGKLVGYECTDGEVIIQMDDETFIHTNVEYVTQVWINWRMGKPGESYGEVGGKYYGVISASKDNIIFTDNSENGIDYENNDIPTDLLEIAQKEQKRFI